MSTTKKKIAFVVQRCGAEVNGGAELQCLQFAQHLAGVYDTEVLTTCALDYMTWENHYPTGEERLGGTLIRRFPVDVCRNVDEFNRHSTFIHSNMDKSSLSDQEKWLSLQGPQSRELEKYIISSKSKYECFFFFTYLYLPYFLLPHVHEKSILMPTAHDEWPIYMKMWDKFFSIPQKFIFETFEELEFLKKRFPDSEFNGSVVGSGIKRPEIVSGRRFREQFAINQPFLLYVGRIDESKGCRELFENFINLRKFETSPRILVLMGKSVMDIPKHPDIISLGFVDEQSKWDGMAAADWLVNPSPYESLSIVLLEAWSVGTPTLVTDKCDVLVGQSRRSNGGLWFNDKKIFQQIITEIDPLLQKQLGRQGKRFVEKHYTWELVVEKLRSCIERPFCDDDCSQ